MNLKVTAVHVDTNLEGFEDPPIKIAFGKKPRSLEPARRLVVGNVLIPDGDIGELVLQLNVIFVRLKLIAELRQPSCESATFEIISRKPLANSRLEKSPAVQCVSFTRRRTYICTVPRSLAPFARSFYSEKFIAILR